MVRKSDLVVSPATFESDIPAHIVDNLGLLASKAIGPTATRGQLYGIAAAVGKGQSPSHRF